MNDTPNSDRLKLAKEFVERSTAENRYPYRSDDSEVFEAFADYADERTAQAVRAERLRIAEELEIRIAHPDDALSAIEGLRDYINRLRNEKGGGE